MKLYFDLMVRNKKTDTELLIKYNQIDTDTLRVNYNKETKYLLGENKTLFNSFKREFNNKKFNLILSDDSKIETSTKSMSIEALKNNKSELFENWSGSNCYAVYPPNQFEEKYSAYGMLGVRVIE